MRLHAWTWVVLGLLLAVLLATNCWSWQPGTGGGAGGRPPGAEVELFYGWPATYQAEWWRSEDPTLLPRLLETAPFIDPRREMDLQARYFGLLPALADCAFAIALLVGLGLAVEATARRSWSVGVLAGLAVALIVIVMTLAVANQIGEHL